jgi:hypothetical protein
MVRTSQLFTWFSYCLESCPFILHLLIFVAMAKDPFQKSNQRIHLVIVPQLLSDCLTQAKRQMTVVWYHFTTIGLLLCPCSHLQCHHNPVYFGPDHLQQLFKLSNGHPHMNPVWCKVFFGQLFQSVVEAPNSLLLFIHFLVLTDRFFQLHFANKQLEITQLKTATTHCTPARNNRIWVHFNLYCPVRLESTTVHMWSRSWRQV